jgi:hypothetical protein
MVYGKYLRGGYATYDPLLHSGLLRERLIRFGAYGDPAAAPAQVWLHLAALARGRTGYSHGWRELPPLFKTLLMASVDTPEEAAEAQAAGWRTFRTRRASEPLLPTEIMCPASDERGKIRTCETCKACQGATRSPGARSVVIIAHGLDWKVARYAEARHREDGRRVALSLV